MAIANFVSYLRQGRVALLSFGFCRQEENLARVGARREPVPVFRHGCHAVIWSFMCNKSVTCTLRLAFLFMFPSFLQPLETVPGCTAT